ncbi:hypothetical protein JX265_008237 [Neoarthrinium moseri]|uniref:Uncharacterized protein n=1 Tax=Neoarthrinium moseri TaxID=1658444 RepID=A0A9Q0AMT8_9PEZI|nr:uncharacterized protein JN550_004936 [Neoarthrinium moseri]KAI1851957.1 hypothetical protein JX266_002810 [Neoarthrinium moseri]KAI1865190.1 hypothetical protein JX265_008237 [Neoarthrinium moseri]KAI1870790.1 hypothetical protein JN550_004936 [Neoarthrinium moseri]
MVVMPPVHTALRLIRTLSMARPANPGTNSGDLGTEFTVDLELQPWPSASSITTTAATTPASSRPVSPTITTAPDFGTRYGGQLTDLGDLFRSRERRTRSVKRTDSFDSTTTESSVSSTRSQSSSRNRFANRRVRCDEVARKESISLQRQSETCWRDYWD